MATWRMARSLDKLRAQLDELAPRRSKASDGGLGDPSHALRASDHNPRRFPWTDKELVTARDFTHDPAAGLDCQQLYRALVDAQDNRIKYVIWRKRITSGHGGPSPWVPRPYTGSNPHDKHLHISVVADARADATTPWILRVAGKDEIDMATKDELRAVVREELTAAAKRTDVGYARDQILTALGVAPTETAPTKGGQIGRDRLTDLWDRLGEVQAAVHDQPTAHLAALTDAIRALADAMRALTSQERG